jgi:hypothetical protein
MPSHDVLIIGAGLAGQRAALAAAQTGASVAIVSKVAYWPGCVSRGFTPELHGSMAKVAPLLDLELIELDRAACCGGGRDRRAQPGACRHAQRTHVRARAADCAAGLRSLRSL